MIELDSSIISYYSCIQNYYALTLGAIFFAHKPVKIGTIIEETTTHVATNAVANCATAENSGLSCAIATGVATAAHITAKRSTSTYNFEFKLKDTIFHSISTVRLHYVAKYHSCLIVPVFPKHDKNHWNISANQRHSRCAPSSLQCHLPSTYSKWQ